MKIKKFNIFLLSLLFATAVQSEELKDIGSKNKKIIKKFVGPINKEMAKEIKLIIK